jgi:hypothetical protein
MKGISKDIKEVDWKNGVVSRAEAERFVARFAKVLLKQAVKNKTRSKKNGHRNH